MVVGWYHSHPGFGCWMSGVDINTQQSFEALNQRAVAIVIDPVQSVKGKVVRSLDKLHQMWVTSRSHQSRLSFMVSTDITTQWSLIIERMN